MLPVRVLNHCFLYKVAFYVCYLVRKSPLHTILVYKVPALLRHLVRFFLQLAGKRLILAAKYCVFCRIMHATSAGHSGRESEPLDGEAFYPILFY